MSAARTLLFVGVFPIAVGAVIGCIQGLWRNACQDAGARTYWTPPPASPYVFEVSTAGTITDLRINVGGAAAEGATP